MNRSEMISRVIGDLEGLKDNSQFKYAIGENIIFFRAASSINKYIRWIISRAPKIDGKRLMEVNDFPFPEWDKRMHDKLMEVERRNFPGLVRPLVKRIVDFAIGKDRSLKILSLGAGGMEVERQIITRLISVEYPHPVTFIGIDKSDIAHQLAKKNFYELESNSLVEVRDTNKLEDSTVEQSIRGGIRFKVLLSKTDIFSLSNYFPPAFFDLAYHSLFKHHLVAEDKVRVDEVMKAVAKKSIEYDGFRSMALLVPQSISGWQDPVFLNAVVFSNLRYKRKKDLLATHGDNRIRFFPIGFYLLES